MSEWRLIDIADVPEGDAVLVFDGEAFGVTISQMIGGCWSDLLNEDYPIFPTHWMPLPEPPQDARQ